MVYLFPRQEGLLINLMAYLKDLFQIPSISSHNFFTLDLDTDMDFERYKSLCHYDSIYLQRSFLVHVVDIIVKKKLDIIVKSFTDTS